MSRTPTLDRRRQSTLPARSGAGFSGETAAVGRRNSVAVAGPVAGSNISANADSPLSMSSGRSSDSPSPERSTPAAKFGKHHQQYKKKQPLLLQRRSSLSGARPAPRGLAAAAAAANARASLGGAGTAAAGGDGDSAAADSDAVAAAALGADRAAGARAMRSALEGLRGERDSLANACGRLEADREAASVQLREGGEVVRKLTEAKETLEADKRALEEKCAALKEEVEAWGRGERAEGGGAGRTQEQSGQAASERASALQTRVAELEKERGETAELVRIDVIAYKLVQVQCCLLLCYDFSLVLFLFLLLNTAVHCCFEKLCSRRCLRCAPVFV